MITRQQYLRAKQIVREYEERSDKLLTIKHLMEIHPELTKEEAGKLFIFCSEHTIFYKECYGDGSIMMPKFKALKK
jgi:hypothetical protein